MILTGLICGALLGFVMQRGRFCLTGGFRDMYIAKDNRMFYALLIAIAVQSIGVFLLIDFGVFEYSAGSLPIVAVIVGSFIFGIGIIFAGGCATGTWYRAGEGLIGSWIALAGYMLMAAIMKTGVLLPLNQKIQSGSELPSNSIAGTFGVNHWFIIIPFAAIVLFIVYKQLSKPKVSIPLLKPKRTGLAHILFEKRWHPFVTATLVGVIAILAWPLSVATGRISGLGITTPSANILQYLTTGDNSFLNWGVFLVLGIFVGSFIAAKASNEFRFRMPDVKTGINSFVGGNLMGFGASIAGGCSIGNGLVMTAMMTWQGWIALAFMILGTWTASYFVFVRPRQKAKATKLQSVPTT
ncbi:membrane protein [Ureibacillus massiliensis 4400831 = CIP 108448 = CCUG 49529]|uniref:Membrane protein n=1 Tax=Ureibacillus massiliensis 4400831 = CIP 108448 = CCUG 49529 TaxID=1211035 RepID=A0A0A3IZQ3_9BACL|nr:YeeE/YedE family protein [Ureibacillus massiliensis]KGR90249.1 membrane protein [Ureibacillus massiliensis 4400831 = CIP 108448 = CCUG 49529]RKJ57067.1 YeeE/YedE family protein [Butyricicoccus sp. 1XD8-22]